MTKIFVLFLCTIPALLYPQQSEDSPKVVLAIETYAFLKGQSAALKAVADQFPALKAKAAGADKTSEVLFAKAQRNIEEFLQEELTGQEFAALQKRIDSLIGEQLRNPIENQKYAVDFIEKVAKGPPVHFR